MTIVIASLANCKMKIRDYLMAIIRVKYCKAKHRTVRYACTKPSILSAIQTHPVLYIIFTYFSWRKSMRGRGWNNTVHKRLEQYCTQEPKMCQHILIPKTNVKFHMPFLSPYLDKFAWHGSHICASVTFYLRYICHTTNTKPKILKTLKNKLISK